jgi:hypothetical protein
LSFIEIAVIIIFWASTTVIGFWLISRFKGERASFVGGWVFLGLGVIVPMYLTISLHDYLICTTSTCEAAKIQSQTLIGLFGISWASIGANLLAAVLTHK